MLLAFRPSLSNKVGSSLSSAMRQSWQSGTGLMSRSGVTLATFSVLPQLDPMSKITELASGQITDTEAITIILSEPDDMPSSVIIHWPEKSTVVNPRRFRDTAATVARMFSEAHIALARIKARRRQ